MGSIKTYLPLFIKVAGEKRIFRFRRLKPSEDAIAAVGIISDPPPGCHKVLNLYVDQEGKLKYTFDDSGG